MSNIQPIFREVLALCAWLVILSVIFVPLERLFALRPNKIWRPAILQDLGYYFFNGIAAALVLAIPISWAITGSHEIMPDAYLRWIGGLPMWATILATFLVGEVGFYWGHRLSHEWGPLWYFHAVHHEPTHLDFLVNTRASPVDIIFTRLCGLVPVYLLGLGNPNTSSGQIAPLLLLIGGKIWSFFIHANLRWRLGWFETILSSPRFHHWHHARLGPINRNYAPMVPFVDKLFGTYHLPENGSWPERYGIRTREEDAPVPEVKADQPSRVAS